MLLKRVIDIIDDFVSYSLRDRLTPFLLNYRIFFISCYLLFPTIGFSGLFRREAG